MENVIKISDLLAKMTDTQLDEFWKHMCDATTILKDASGMETSDLLKESPTYYNITMCELIAFDEYRSRQKGIKPHVNH